MLSWLSPSVAALHIPHEDTTWGHHAAHGEKQIRAFTVVNGCDVSVTKDRINCSSFKMTGRKIPFCSWPTITRCLGWNSRVWTRQLYGILTISKTKSLAIELLDLLLYIPGESNHTVSEGGEKRGGNCNHFNTRPPPPSPAPPPPPPPPPQ